MGWVVGGGRVVELLADVCYFFSEVGGKVVWDEIRGSRRGRWDEQ